MSLDFAKARDIFIAALEQAGPEERRAFVADACGEDQELRKQVDLLLRSHEQPASFLDKLGVAPSTVALEMTEQVGTVIGPYKLLQKIGEGGMGVVFMAEQHEPIRRTVAFKIIKPGMDSRQVIARFEAERQALAVLDHPNIARVLDAGTTTSGRPYFVMELVKGVPITTYCDQQNLSVRKRLELMASVCHAVQHAHQKGIIHRDIKPSNVLVAEYDDQAMPKVIDFGVAKATAHRLTERTMFTEYGQIVGTLEYMSPEQARFNQLDVDTRTDIYSLGVLLYELLAGSTPLERERLRAAAFEQILHLISDEEPPRPSLRVGSSASLAAIAAHRGLDPGRLTAMLRGDLDWIVMKALEKDRSRRYETASSLGHDLEHFLMDQPVQARPPSSVYRLRKFVRRNRLPVTAAILLGISILGGLAATSFMYLRERAAREAAVAADERSRQWLELLKTVLWGGSGATELQTPEQLQSVLEELPIADATVDDARTLNNLGLELRNRRRLPEALVLLRRALDIFEFVFHGDNAETLACLNNLALTLLDLGNLPEAEQASRRAVAMADNLWGEDSPQLAKQVNDLGVILKDLGRYPQAEEALQQALAIRRREGIADFATGETLFHLAEVARGRRDLPAAVGLYRDSLEMFRQAPNAPEAAKVGVLLELAVTLMEQGEFGDAKEVANESLDLYKQLDPHSSGWQVHYARSVLGEAMAANGKSPDAESLLRSGYEGMLPHQASIPRRYFRAALVRLVEYYERNADAANEADWRAKLTQFDGGAPAE